MTKYKFFCDHCQFTKYVDANVPVNLEPLISSPVPGGFPKLNPENQKVEKASDIPRTKRYKCPTCGMLIKPKKIAEEQINHE